MRSAFHLISRERRRANTKPMFQTVSPFEFHKKNAVASRISASDKVIEYINDSLDHEHSLKLLTYHCVWVMTLS